ncbi:MAG: Hsp20/alpha crystallin family protein [Betaproteobacteria bacterium]|nr:Hsp20/alpha crystallin family protein [Betaproteobacteria bacterium]
MGTLKPLNLFEASVPGVFKGMFPPMWVDAQPAPPAIKVDVAETDDRYTVKADMPGVTKEDIRVEVDGNMVSIAAEVRREKIDEKEGKVLRTERHVGTMTRAFTLPMEVDVAKAEAKYAEGVLMLTLPKRRGAPTHRLAIN